MTHIEAFKKLELHSQIQSIIISSNTRIAIICATFIGFNKIRDTITEILKSYEPLVAEQNRFFIRLTNNSEIKLWVQDEVSLQGYHPHIKIIDDFHNIDQNTYDSCIVPMGRRTCFMQINFKNVS